MNSAVLMPGLSDGPRVMPFTLLFLGLAKDPPTDGRCGTRTTAFEE